MDDKLRPRQQPRYRRRRRGGREKKNNPTGRTDGKIPICMHLPIRSIYVRVVRASIYKVTISGIICANSKRSADVSNARVLLQYVCTLPWVFV